MAKNPKNLDFDFQRKNQKYHKGYSMPPEIGSNGDGQHCSNFGQKLNVHVQNNMLRPKWPAPVA